MQKEHLNNKLNTVISYKNNKKNYNSVHLNLLLMNLEINKNLYYKKMFRNQKDMINLLTECKKDIMKEYINKRNWKRWEE